MNYNGQAELKDGSFTVITAASQGSTLGSQISDFVGMYHASAYLPEYGQSISWDTVKIYTYTSSDNEEWVCVTGLIGAEEDVAVGKFNATNKAIQLHRGLHYKSNTFTLQDYGDTLFYSVFYPIYFNSESDCGLIESMEDGEAWLTFNSDKELILGPSNTADSQGHFADGYIFGFFYHDDNEFAGWNYILTQLVLTKFSSVVEAPARVPKQVQWHAPMKLPAKMQNNKALRRR